MIYVIIVLYNKKCNESKTLTSILNNHNLNINIYDNSNEEYIMYNKKYCIDNNINYYYSGNNDGLSKSYNYIIDKIELNDSNYILLLDDDTFIPKNYIDTLFEKISTESFDVLMPKVISNGKLISPCYITKYGRVKKIKSMKLNPNKKITGINSGLLVKSSIYKDFLYDENIFLDYVDHYFFNWLNKNNKKIIINEITLLQDFSRDHIGNYESTKMRFIIFKKDLKRFIEVTNGSKLYYYINIIKLACIYSLYFKRIFIIGGRGNNI